MRARSSVALAATLAVVLAGCDGGDPEAVEIDEAGVEDLEAAPEPGDAEVDAGSEQEDAARELDDAREEDDAPVGDNASEDHASEENDGTAQVEDGPMAAPSCDLATTTGDTELTVDAYEQAVLETNFDLELLVMDLSADLDEVLSGVSDGPTLEEQLLDHQQRYAEVTAEVADVQAPDGAEDWHERAMESYDAVCVAIADGLAFSAAGDDDRSEAFLVALTEFPTVLHQLHANAACGPFEDC